MLTLDPEIMQELQSISPMEKQVWKLASDMLIDQGLVERLDQKGLSQAIDNASYEIVRMAFYLEMTEPESHKDCTSSMYAEHPVVGTDVKQLDTIIETIALSSGIHPGEVAALIDLRVQQMVQELFRKKDK